MFFTTFPGFNVLSEFSPWLRISFKNISLVVYQRPANKKREREREAFFIFSQQNNYQLFKKIQYPEIVSYNPVNGLKQSKQEHQLK